MGSITVTALETVTGIVEIVLPGPQGPVGDIHPSMPGLVQTATDAATSATASALSADTSEANASASAAAALVSQDVATTKATEAASSASNAAASETAALASKNAAAASATSASGSATTATTKADEATASATAAASSATGADTSATNAAASATSASGSASTATTQATRSADWAEKTAGTVDGVGYSSKYHAQLASTSAQTATTKASEAATSATNAAASATTASTKASEASTSATNAAASATAAATSATNAATSAASALQAKNDAVAALASKLDVAATQFGGNAASASSVAWTGVSGRPTTLAGYGITDAVSTASRGVANGVATLDASGLVPSTQLPSYVDDVLEYANLAGFPATGAAGKIYVALDTNKTYRWSGSGYVYITSGAVDRIDIPLDIFAKSDRTSVAFIKTGGQTVSLKSGLRVQVGSTLFTFAANTPVTMPTLTAGEDYAIWCTPAGALVCNADPFSAPASAPVAGSRKIGGFHYGLVAPGTTPAGGSFATSGFTTQGGSMIWTQAAVDRIAGINEFSLWDLAWRCKGQQRGMALDPQTEVWHAIYFCSVNHIANGISRYNTDVASGTVLPRIPLAYGGDGSTNYGRLSQYECEEIAASFGLRLPTPDEFRSAAFGVTEGQSLGGASSTIPSTARQPGYTSRLGIEQATGHLWVFARGNSSSGGTGFVAGPNRGDSFGNLFATLLGGDRLGAASSGSRASHSYNVAWVSYWTIALRAAGDHLKHV